MKYCFVLSRQQLYLDMVEHIFGYTRTCMCICDDDIICVGHWTGALGRGMSVVSILTQYIEDGYEKSLTTDTVFLACLLRMIL